MKKQSFILAVAIATFTLTACSEKTQTPEEMKMVAIKNGKEAGEALKNFPHKNTFNDFTKEEIKTFDSLVEIANKGYKASNDIRIIATFEESKKLRKESEERFERWQKGEETIEDKKRKELLKKLTTPIK